MNEPLGYRLRQHAVAAAVQPLRPSLPRHKPGRGAIAISRRARREVAEIARYALAVGASRDNPREISERLDDRVRKALNAMADEGKIEKHPGQGNNAPRNDDHARGKGNRKGDVTIAPDDRGGAGKRHPPRVSPLDEPRWFMQDIDP